MNRLKYIAVLAGLFLSLGLSKAQQLDSTRLAALDSLLEQYYDAMLFEDVATKVEECDFLIGASRDSIVRNWVAQRILTHYMDSPRIMGEEAVAVYVYDNWYKTKKVSSEEDYFLFSAEMFAEFNRQNLLGMKAPELDLLLPASSATVHVPQKDVVNVIYFYTPSCSHCQANAVLLPYAFDDVNFDVNFYAIYVGDDAEEWLAFRRSFSIQNENVKLIHLWDPESDSDYQMKYGVITTPKLFLVGRDGIIEGRRLEVDSLKQILNIYSSYSAQNGKVKKSRS